jgi:hypothetical protein
VEPVSFSAHFVEPHHVLSILFTVDFVLGNSRIEGYMTGAVARDRPVPRRECLWLDLCRLATWADRAAATGAKP